MSSGLQIESTASQDDFDIDLRVSASASGARESNAPSIIPLTSPRVCNSTNVSTCSHTLVLQCC
jgi:hypothetical protein